MTVRSGEPPLEPLQLFTPVDIGKPCSPARTPGAITVGATTRTDGVADYVCSAAAVNTATKNVIITAGHCASKSTCFLLSCRGEYFTNFLFVPRYANGTAPDGRWVGTQAITHQAWFDNENLAYDQALIKVANLNGRRLVDVVGGNGLAWNFPARENDIRVWGWPAEAPYDGSTAHRCYGNTSSYDGSGDAMISCPMTGGASGGPWFLSMASAGSGFTWAVTSRRTVGGPQFLVARPLSAAALLLVPPAARPPIRATRLVTAAYSGIARRTPRAPMAFMAYPDDVGTGQLLGIKAWARPGTRVVLQLRFPGTGWRSVFAKLADGAGHVHFPHGVGAPGTRYYRTVTSTSRSNEVRVVVHSCPLPADQRAHVVNATRCTPPTR